MSRIKGQPGEIKLGDTIYKLSARWGSLTRLCRVLAPQRSNRGAVRSGEAYSHLDAIRELWRVEAGNALLIDSHVLTVFVWALLHVEERGKLYWADLTLEQVTELLSEYVEQVGTVRDAELAVFSLVLDQLYADGALVAPDPEKPANPTQAADETAAKIN